MNISDVKACMFNEWYPRFKDITPKSKIFPLIDDFKDYLLSDGLILPESAGLESRLVVKSSSDDENEIRDDVDDEWDDEDDELKAPDFGEFEKAIAEAITELGGEVFPKLNWSAPQDAVWVTFENSLKCTTPGDIYLLLKSSDFITRDLTQPFIHCDDADGNDTIALQHYLVLRRWVTIQPGLEFRCFVKNKSFIAIAQRHYNKYYEFMPAMSREIVHGLSRFFALSISPKFPLDSYVFDVYRDRHKRWRLIDFNPFGILTDSPLFPWSELHAWTHTQTEPELRYIESEGTILPHPFSSCGLSSDITDLCSGQDPNKLVDFLQLQTKISSQNRGEESPDSGEASDAQADVSS